jgi:hypothetical protein
MALSELQRRTECCQKREAASLEEAPLSPLQALRYSRISGVGHGTQQSIGSPPVVAEAPLNSAYYVGTGKGGRSWGSAPQERCWMLKMGIVSLISPDLALLSLSPSLRTTSIYLPSPTPGSHERAAQARKIFHGSLDRLDLPFFLHISCSRLEFTAFNRWIDPALEQAQVAHRHAYSRHLKHQSIEQASRCSV